MLFLTDSLISTPPRCSVVYSHCRDADTEQTQVKSGQVRSEAVQYSTEAVQYSTEAVQYTSEAVQYSTEAVQYRSEAVPAIAVWLLTPNISGSPSADVMKDTTWDRQLTNSESAASRR